MNSYIPLFDAELTCVVLGFSTGIALANSFKNFDYKVQRTEWFKKLGTFRKYLVKSALDVFHHFQYGLILMLFAQIYVEPNHPLLFWILYSLGFGVVTADIRDIPPRFRRFFGVEVKRAESDET